MNTPKITKAKQRSIATGKMEDSAMELVHAAEEMAMQTGLYARTRARIHLLAKARQYARALDALSRVG